MVFLNCVSITRPSKTEGFTIWYTIIVCKITQYALSHFIISNIAAQWVSSNNNGMEDKAMGSSSTEFVYKIPKKEKKKESNKAGRQIYSNNVGVLDLPIKSKKN